MMLSVVSAGEKKSIESPPWSRLQEVLRLHFERALADELLGASRVVAGV